MTTQANHMPLSPVSFLLRARRAYPAKPALIDVDGSTMTYAALARNADALAGSLRARGVSRGDRVAILDLNTGWLTGAHFGVPGSGAVLVALDTRLAPAEYRDILAAHASVEVLLVAPSPVPALGVASASEFPVRCVVLLPGPAVALPGAVALSQWLAGGDGGPIQLPPDEHDMAAVNYTSGTAGTPKGVIYTHRGAHLNALSVALELELSSSSRYLWTLPMFHCNGWSLVWA